MIFTLNYYFRFTYIFIIFYITLISTSYNHLIGYWSIDLHTRSDLNLAGLSNLFWIWTNTYYLYSILIILLFSIMLYAYKEDYSVKVFVFLVYYALIFLELASNHNLTLSSSYKTTELELYNLLLNNSINKIHPLMIYVSWFSIIILSVSSFASFNRWYYTSNVFILFKLVIAASLLLGGWWAYQEGSWGGWWNWDPSEMFGLLILFSLVLSTHASLTKSYSSSYYIKVILSYTLIYYVFLQLNFSLLSHNFGIRQGDIIDFRVSYLLFIATGIYLIRRKLLSLNSTIYLEPRRIGVSYIYYIIPLVLYAVLYVSSAELWSDLIWRIFGMDLYNSSSLLSPILLVTALLLITRYSNIALLSSISIFLTLSTNNVLVPISLYVLSIGWLKYLDLHKLALLYIIFIFTYSNFTSIVWGYKSTSLWVDTLVINAPLIHGDCTSMLNLYFNYFSLLMSNTLETKPFSLINFNALTEQRYSISLDDVAIHSSTYDFCNVLVIAIVIILLILFLRSINKLMIIKF